MEMQVLQKYVDRPKLIRLLQDKFGANFEVEVCSLDVVPISSTFIS